MVTPTLDTETVARGPGPARREPMRGSDAARAKGIGALRDCRAEVEGQADRLDAQSQMSAMARRSDHDWRATRAR